MMHLSTVEKQGFSKLMSVMDAKYTLHGQNYFVLNIYPSALLCSSCLNIYYLIKPYSVYYL